MSGGQIILLEGQFFPSLAHLLFNILSHFFVCQKDYAKMRFHKSLWGSETGGAR